MEENITSDTQEDFGVKLERRQYRERAYSERSTLVMSEQEMREALGQLTRDERKVLCVLLSFLAQSPLPAESHQASDFATI